MLPHLFILSGTFFKLLKDYKARYMGIGKVDKDMALFYEDKKEKEENKQWIQFFLTDV